PSARLKGNSDPVWSIWSVRSVRSFSTRLRADKPDRPKRRDRPDQPDRPDAGGLFQHIMVDFHHTCIYQFLIEPFLQGNLNRFRMALLACPLRFTGNKIT